MLQHPQEEKIDNVVTHDWSAETCSPPSDDLRGGPTLVSLSMFHVLPVDGEKNGERSNEQKLNQSNGRTNGTKKRSFPSSRERGGMIAGRVHAVFKPTPHTICVMVAASCWNTRCLSVFVLFYIKYVSTWCVLSEHTCSLRCMVSVNGSSHTSVNGLYIKP